MSTVVTCTFDGIVGAQVVETIANGNDVYVVYDDGTGTLKAKRISISSYGETQTIATDVTSVD